MKMITNFMRYPFSLEKTFEPSHILKSQNASHFP